MEKYGVEQPDTTKTSTESGPKKNCPQCGTRLYDTDNTGVLLCPLCGTKPFEEE